VDSAYWNPANPRFFSGTNCSAKATAAAVIGHVTIAQLLVGGTVVKNYYDTSITGPYPVNTTLGTNQTSAGLSVNFDSTHFPDVNAIPIQMTVNDSGSSADTYTDTIQAGAYNEGYVGYEPTTVSGQANAQVVDSAMAACNINNNDSNITDNRDMVLSAVKYNTTFFTCNHGNETPDANNHVYFEPPAGVGTSNGLIFGNQRVDTSSTTANPRDDVAEAVAKKHSYPPPYNFVYLDVCNGALNSEFADGFGVSASGNTDRALLGWAGVVADNQVNLQWTGRLYTALASGKTLQASVAAADTTDPNNIL